MRLPSDQQPFQSIDISRRLRLLMVQHDLTVGRLADIAGVSKSAVEKYLAGPSSPRATAIASIARGLDVSTDFLLFGEGKVDEQLLLDEAHLTMMRLVDELKQSEEFRELELGTEAWRRFSNRVAYEQAWRFRAAFLRALDEHKRNGMVLAFGPQTRLPPSDR